MVATRSARERKAAAQAGPLARVRIDLDETEQFLYKISCSTCRAKGHRSWSAYRPGGDNGFMAIMDRWIFHLVEKHPGAEAPCLAFLSEAQQRLHERRDAAPGGPESSTRLEAQPRRGRTAMTTTPGDATSDDQPDDAMSPAADPSEKAGAEIGMTEGEGSTFEPEEDPESASGG